MGNMGMDEKPDKDQEEHHLHALREWLERQEYLPQNINDTFLKRFLNCCNNSVETAKGLIDLCFTIRSQTPEIFENRDPLSPSIQNIIKTSDMVPLPNYTDNNYQVFIYRLCDPDPDKFVYADSLKTFFMFSDLRMLTDINLPDGEVPIFDMSGLCLRHISKVSLHLLKKYMQYTQEAHPVRLKQIHIINTPSFVDKMMLLIKPFLKNETGRMMHFHSSDLSTLYEYVPKDLLPEEYGGESGKLSDLKSQLTQKLINNRDLFLDETRWKVDESKRPVKDNKSKQLFGIEGSFRSLSID
ncbi:alpha-tocopherol transfer protein-like isoform X2 [Agrilus planipennis]|uniref:Alpha-tocopherol transfer protein-like isoform X2 n=1 Tax=Agrilus planipennis TaxID=224129 RepID=A0A7F5R3L7_AGRPL|nr:alpha-tocopherol transfer protein-like isoform X2 [Agrilus planipennis]